MGGAIPRQEVLGRVRRQAGQAMGNKLVTSGTPLWFLLQFLPGASALTSLNDEL